MKKAKPSPFLALITAGLCLLSFNLSAFSGEENAGNHLDKIFFRNFAADVGGVLQSPVEWKGKDCLRLSAVLVAGFGLYAADSDIQDWMFKQKSTTSEDVSRFVSTFGHGLFLAPFLTSLYLVGEVGEEESLRRTALLGLESWVVSGVLVTGIKFVTGRARPKTEEDSSTFRPLASSSRFRSLPSGHAASAFAVASVIAGESEDFSLDFLAYSLAVLAALSRVHDNEHWASDVFLGSALGYFVGKKISKLNRKRESGSLRISFQFSAERQALCLSLSF